MSTPTPSHATTANGRTSWEITDKFRPLEDQVRRGVTVLDGVEAFATSLWRLPEGLRVADNIPVGYPFSYLQSAGSAERMTVEMRVSHGDDEVADHFVVGRPVADQFAEPLVEVPWAEHVQTVFANEVFDAAEAGDIYWYYYQHDTVPERYSFRRLEI